MSSKKTIKKIKTLEMLRSQTLEEMLRIQTMLPGSFYKGYCRCGKMNCWCYAKDKSKDKAGHPYKRITWSEKGVKKSKTIPENDVVWIKGVTANYRNFRKKCKEIQRLEENIRSLIDNYKKDIVQETRKLKQYL